MKKDSSNIPGASELRRWAEEQLKKSGLKPYLPTSEAEWKRGFHELSVHQIELEMQNEQLRDAYEEIQQEHTRYSDLYDFAPVGYLTLDRDGRILEANLTIDKMLSCERSRLKGSSFGQFIVQRDLPVFNSMLHKVFESRTVEHCEIMIGNIGAPQELASLQRTFRLDAIISDNMQECRLTITDISDAQRAVEGLKHKEAQYRCLFEAAQEGILILTTQAAKSSMPIPL